MTGPFGISQYQEQISIIVRCPLINTAPYKKYRAALLNNWPVIRNTLSTMGGVGVLLACLVLGGTIVEPYKILMVYPSYSKSHLIIATAAMKGLAEEGHQVSSLIQTYNQCVN